MAGIDASIIIMQKALTELLERVEKGGVLTREEAQAIVECRRGFDQLKQLDTYKEVLRGTKLKELTDKWA